VRTHRLLAAAPVALVLYCVSCGGAPTPPAPPPPPATPASSARPDEPHFAELRQLTFGGENAEAYWSWGGDQLILQARGPGQSCDRIVRTNPFLPAPVFTPVSNGEGATTCSFFLPGDRDVIYASTQLGGPACPPRPDHSQGYVWPLYSTYDIFRAKADGSGVVRLTDTPGYDAEGTVCGKDGSIVFTSVRDGDIDLYRMDADGKNVRRLTDTPGYDGGAFFNADCSKIVWRAGRPKGKDLEDFRRLLGQGLVRPTKLELYVANADGSDARQITYLDAASFAPYWHPSQRRILFSSNWAASSPREFDMWAIDIDGTRLERVTTAPGFDGFPMFSPDGKWLAFSSNRATPEGQHDTNLFVARWAESTPRFEETAADRTMRDDAWLADPAREGRGVGTHGLDEAGAYVEKAFKDAGLAPAGSEGYRLPFDATTKVTGAASLQVARAEKLAAPSVQPLGFSSPGVVEAPLVDVGWGIVEGGWDDYAHHDVKGKIAVVRRFVPDDPKLAKSEDKRRLGDLRRKAWVAREHGAKDILVVDLAKDVEEAPFPELAPDVAGDAGIVAAIVSRAAFAPIVDAMKHKRTVATLEVALKPETARAFDVVARWPAAAQNRLPGVVVVGAHYDHLGFGGRDSLSPGEHAVHPGADDNASGTAALLEIGRMLAERTALRRDVVLVAFSGEEMGVLGSTWFVKHPLAGLAPADIVGMLNMDMVGRLRDNTLQVFGAETATQWSDMLGRACDAARVECVHAAGGGFGASDHAPFYGAGVPVLHFFSGVHADYHKPSDTPDKVNAAGMAQTARIVASMATELADHEGRLDYQKVPSPPPSGDVRSFGSSLGTVPDYAGPPKGQRGMLLAGVRPGGAAEKAGLERGDVLVRLGDHPISGVEDLMYVLTESKPGTTMKAVVVREGKEIAVDVTLQEGRKH
jgi:Tol biopolymer transport system component